MQSRMIKAALAGAAIVAGFGENARSQQDDAGLTFTIGISSDLRTHDNLDLDPVSAGSTTRFDNRLRFGIESETRRQKLAFNVAGTVRGEDAPGSGFSFGSENASADLKYALEGADARFAFDAGFRRTDVDGFTLASEGVDPAGADLIADTGIRETRTAMMTLETGLNAPVGFALQLEHRGTRYQGTTDPGLYDRMTNSAKATTSLRFSALTVAKVTASVSRYEAKDATSTTRDTRELSFGVAHEVSETTVVETSVGLREIDDSVTGEKRGPVVSLSLVRILPRGQLVVRANSEQTTTLRQSTIEVERQFALPSGALTVGLGATQFKGLDARAIGRLNYSHELPRGQITASLSRSFNVNDEANIQRVTQGSLGVKYQINAPSALNFGVSYTDIRDAGTGGVVNRSSGSFRAAYQHELARDWALSVGYERRYLMEAGSGTANDNAVFVTLDRSISWRR